MDPLFEGIAFRDPAGARRNISRLAPHLPERGLATLERLIRQVPDPDSALNHLERYAKISAQPLRQLFSPISRLRASLTIFSHSHFLAETLYRHPELLEWTLRKEKLYRVLSRDEFRSDLGWLDAASSDADVARTLGRFKRMHVLRIALRDLLGLATLAEVTLELSNLADAVLQGAQEQVQQQLLRRFGRPLAPAESGPIECEFAVLALGKLGALELNYSSDIDLMFLYARDGETAGPIRVSNRDFATQLAHRLTSVLSHRTVEGSCYRIDLRLRPEGSMGELVLPLQSMMQYYHRRARDWELQMLIKARPAAGSARLGHSFLKMVEDLIYQTTTDFSTVERMAQTRDRMRRDLGLRAKRGLNVKLARGGIRDIEFLVQCMQRLYGGRDRWVRSGGTLYGLHRLRDKGYISTPDYSKLNAAYLYLRALEHRLQLEHDRQTHTIPDKQEAQMLLSRRMQGEASPRSAGPGLLSQVQTHLTQVTEIYDRVIGAQKPTLAVPLSPAPESAGGEEHVEKHTAHSWRSQLRHIDKHHPDLAGIISSLPIRWGSHHFEHFINKVISMPALLAEFEEQPRLMSCVGDLIEHSPFVAEHLIRHPSDVQHLKTIASAAGEPAPGAEARSAGGRGTEKGSNETPVPCEPADLPESDAPLPEKSEALRRRYRRRMLQILGESIHSRHPIFSTLQKTSDLADEVIGAAYEIAVQEVCRRSKQSRPEHPLQVIALGRLGMREFDLGSDADLVFALPDDAVSEKPFWTSVVERLINVISSYTQEGIIFTVDTRLRPMGRDGELVQTESSFKRYFAQKAEAWEGIAYMKARAVAGDLPRGTKFLSELQEVDWRRYGMSSNLGATLVTMRRKLEEEQGPTHPFKAGAGGYYDIDFILLYLRLRDAGLFFRSLNTPERIEVLRTAGSLTTSQAETLARLAVFFRSLDHGIRVSAGATNKIPTSRRQLEMVTELLGRWSGVRPREKPLADLAAQVRAETRQLFSQIFAETDSPHTAG